MTFHIDDIAQKSKREILEVWDEAVKHMGLQDKRIAELEQENLELTEAIEHSGIDVDEVIDSGGTHETECDGKIYTSCFYCESDGDHADYCIYKRLIAPTPLEQVK